MSQTTTPDRLDELLSDFFKSKLPQRWPAAPVPASSGLAEPAGVVAARSGPPPAGNRARYTLAASVALLLGTCWLLSSGSQPASHPVTKPATGGPDVLQNGSANLPEPLGQIRENKAKKTTDPMVGFQPPPVNLP